ncbi:MAG: response regulator [Anaerolineae bacterium]|uniref:response regulator n=1 Tax=Candidatus Flexifilum breve TaxID=3140694 RepID=UPI001AD32CEA|nr:response regulator [Chloroflexota bacterium]MBK9747958.1 response regulator [Chloroflexota bacterium]MBN8638583.1 response regulator [Anaerolineae bacterium]
MAKSILIVDDDALNRELLQTVLKRAGYTVLQANSGKSAISLVETEIPNLILLDVRMVGMSGYEVCKHLKSNPQTKAIPVIMLTAYDEKSGEREHAEEAGADDFFPKMRGWQVLIEHIQKLIN